MKTRLTNLTLCVMLILPAFAQENGSPSATSFTSDELTKRTIERRAVEAAIWSMPLVSVETMRQAYFRDAGAKYNDILYWSKPSDWKFQK